MTQHRDGTITWETPRSIACEAGEEAAADTVHLDLVLHTKALETLPSIEEVSADVVTCQVLRLQTGLEHLPLASEVTHRLKLARFASFNRGIWWGCPPLTVKEKEHGRHGIVAVSPNTQDLQGHEFQCP